jgi:GntR family transcriptional regulator/MocR family aminotransferase
VIVANRQRPGAPGGPRPFRGGVPATDRFPYEVWLRLLNRHWRRQGAHLLTHAADGGYRPLREAIAEYLRVARAVRCEPDTTTT